MNASDFDAVATAKSLLREARSGALATLDAGSGDPYCSLVNVAFAAGGAPILLLSRLARHTRNILTDPRVALMLEARGAGDPLTGPRMTISGRIASSADEADRSLYLARHPDSAQFAGFADFAVYRITASGAHLVAGFGRIADLKPDEFLGDSADVPSSPLPNA